MQTYELLVKNRSVKTNSDDTTLVRTSIGVDQIHVMFDNAEWLSFPITATLAMGKKIVSTPITLRDISGSDQWVAESTFTIPWEVMQTVGALRVTFQGTDQEGNHIITAFGAPLRVEESGDVTMGDIPESAPTVSQYEQAYARAVQMLSKVDSALRTLGDVVRKSDIATIESPGIVKPDGVTIVINSEGSISTADGYVLVPATESSLGGVIPDGESITIDHDGTIHASISYELPTANSARLGGIRIGNGLKVTPSGVASVDEQFVESHAGHVDIATDEAPGVVKPDGDTITIDADGTIHGTDVVPIATESVPGKVMPDGDTITIDADGTIHGTEQTVIATTNTAGKVKPDGTTITVDEDGTIHATSSGEMTVRAGRVGNEMFVEYNALIFGDDSDGAFRFPMVTTISYGTYMSCASLRSVDFPVCETVGTNAFRDCTSLSYAQFPVCTTVDSDAFRECTSLASVTLPRCVTIGADAFFGCTSLSYVSIPSCSYVAYSAFRDCVSLQSASLPNAKTVGSYAFYGCTSLSHAYLPLCTFVSKAAFGGCSILEGIDLPSCTLMGENAFAGCTALSSVSIPKCTNIWDYTFYKCSSIESVTLPSCVSVGTRAFGDCTNLSRANLGRCGSIAAYAFNGCLRLTKLDLTGVSSVTTLANVNAFAGTPISDMTTYTGGRGLIYVPASLYSKFTSAANWSAYKTRIVSA